MWRSCEWRNFTIAISTKVANAQTGILTVIKFTQILLEQFEHRAYFLVLWRVKYLYTNKQTAVANHIKSLQFQITTLESQFRPFSWSFYDSRVQICICIAFSSLATSCHGLPVSICIMSFRFYYLFTDRHYLPTQLTS